jgi:hypothetical protein
MKFKLSETIVAGLLFVLCGGQAAQAAFSVNTSVTLTTTEPFTFKDIDHVCAHPQGFYRIQTP